MKRGHSGHCRILLLALALAVSGCAYTIRPVPPTTVWAGRELGDFPYHPLIYHLDLSVLAYQLYSQSLIWPFDPYYEQMASRKGARTRSMARTRAWAGERGARQLADSSGLGAYRGPGVLGGFEDNPAHDPIVFDYSRLHPWSPGLTNAEGTWIEYRTPREITRRIRDVYVCFRRTGRPDGVVTLERVAPGREEWDPDARDVLLAFEGGTGDKGERRQPASQSLMGFVLVRHKPGRRYDVHIAFRGSRSGSGSRALLQALSTEQASGNPDWITDMGYRRIGADDGAALVTTTGHVSRGFATSTRSILPALMRCLEEVAVLESGIAPDQVYVTGHSLGGALAQHFVSAMLLGEGYGPAGRGPLMPRSLASWPWTRIKLITFGAPPAGDQTWARTLSVTGLQSEPWLKAGTFNSLDPEALSPADTSIVPRLLDPGHPAGFRVAITADPITTERVFGGGKPVGRSVYVNERSGRDRAPGLVFAAHEVPNIRSCMLSAIADPRTPPLAWRYRPLAELCPDLSPGERGTPAALERLAEAVRRYHDEQRSWFDSARFDRDVALRLRIERGE